MERQQQNGKEVTFRSDAAYAKPEIYQALEERGVKYAIRLPANENLERDIEELLTRPVKRPSQKSVVACFQEFGRAVGRRWDNPGTKQEMEGFAGRRLAVYSEPLEG